MTWRSDMDAAPHRIGVIVAVPTEHKDGWHVGEAYFNPDQGGDWWWAGTSSGDYYAGPISEMNFWPPERWQPLPPPPGDGE